MSSVAERVDAFDLRNGGNPIVDGYRVIFASGAYRDRNPMGILADAHLLPPFERTKIALRYQELKLASLSRQFESLKENLLVAGGTCATDVQIEKLSELRTKIRIQRKTVKDAEKALDDATPAQHKPQRPDPVVQELQMKRLDKIRSIKI